jgi:hypothetical protein
MKKCTWCGKEYVDEASACAIDGHPLKAVRPSPSPSQREVPARPMPSITPEAQRGRLLLLIAFATTLLGDLCIITLKISRIGFPPSIGSVLRWFITAALFYAIWRGHSGVRWLMVGLLGLGLLLSIPAILRSLHPLQIGVAFQVSFTAALLAFPPSVSAFMDYQRGKYSENA